jgi:hypothetical protein
MIIHGETNSDLTRLVMTRVAMRHMALNFRWSALVEFQLEGYRVRPAFPMRSPGDMLRIMGTHLITKSQ